MSLSSFKSSFTNPMLERLQQQARKDVEKQRGQLLLLPGPLELKKAIVDTFGDGVQISHYHYAKAVEKARKRAKGLQDVFYSKYENRFEVIVSRFSELGLPSSYVIGKNAFIVTSFGYSITQVKDAMLKHFTDAGLITSEQKKELSKNIHKGHGAKGNAVSQVQIASSVASIPNKYKSNLGAAFEAYSEKANLPAFSKREIKNLITSHKQMVRKDGKLTERYFSVVSFQLGKENIGIDARMEKAVKKDFENFVQQLTPKMFEMKGSSSMEEKLTRVIVEPFDKKKTIKVTSKSKKAKLETKHKAKATSKNKKIKAGAIKSGGNIKKARIRVRPSNFSNIRLMGLLNRYLPRVVAKNMESPGLEYRTGRFAASVRVTDVITTPQGFPSVGYTYMKNPYQTFEPGFAQGSVERDPRKLIDSSIREIAAQYAIGRFYTRRV
jgi:hypothetical protein